MEQTSDIGFGGIPRIVENEIDLGRPDASGAYRENEEKSSLIANLDGDQLLDWWHKTRSRPGNTGREEED